MVVTIFAAAATGQKLAGNNNNNNNKKEKKKRKKTVKFSSPFRATKLTDLRTEKKKQRTNISQNKAAQQDPRGNNPERIHIQPVNVRYYCIIWRFSSPQRRGYNSVRKVCNGSNKTVQNPAQVRPE